MRMALASLVVSAVALAMAWSNRSDTSTASRRSDPSSSARLASLEREVAALRAQLDRATGRTERSDNGGPTAGLTPPDATGDPSVTDDRASSNPTSLAAMTEEAVDRTARRVIDEIERKKNKRPDIRLFAESLELSTEQRRDTEKIVADGQHRIHELLRVPTADGTVLMDELVEKVALGYAKPGQDHGMSKLFQRIIREKVPGTDSTYGARIEGVKGEMRKHFQKRLTKKQYAKFEQWELDPSEIQNVKGTPNAELWRRIRERARELGATIPQPK